MLLPSGPGSAQPRDLRTVDIHGVITWLTTFMDDDPVADVPVSFDRTVLAKQLTSVGASTPSEVRLTDGNDDLTVTITATRVS